MPLGRVLQEALPAAIYLWSAVELSMLSTGELVIEHVACEMWWETGVSVLSCS